MLSLKTVAGTAAIVGFLTFAIFVARGPRQQDTFPEGLLTLGGVLFVGGIAVVLLIAGKEWFQRYRPSSEHRDLRVADAQRLGLEYLGRDTSSLDRSFAFLRGRGPADNLNRLAQGIFYPTFDAIAAGRWNGLEIRVFDYSRVNGDNREEWTCVQLPMERPTSKIQIMPRSGWSRALPSIVGRHDLALGDEKFDRAFSVRADAEDEARELIDSNVRKYVVRGGKVVIEMRENLLYCTLSERIDDRIALLHAAVGLRKRIPPRI